MVVKNIGTKDQLTFHQKLHSLMDAYAHQVYDCTMVFPKEEAFGVTSQLRRASLSVILNYTEGYARQRKAVLKNFLEISFGSLKESAYLVGFSYKRGYLKKESFEKLTSMSQEIGAMLWGVIRKIG